MPSPDAMRDPIAPVARIDPDVQRLLLTLQCVLVDVPYVTFGRPADAPSDARRFNLVFPASFGSARRKPVTQRFQSFTESHFWVVARLLLFGSGWSESVAPFLLSHKVNTLAIGEGEAYYGENIFHLHVDGSVGRRVARDRMQKRRYRFLVSFVPPTVCDPRSTVYLKTQPPDGCASTRAMHTWLVDRFVECGLSEGRSRPLYRVTENDIVRAMPGDVFMHPSHGFGSIGAAYPIHAEANPCPSGRVYHAIDLDDLIVTERANSGKGLRLVETRRVPVETVIALLGASGSPDHVAMVRRTLSESLRMRVLCADTRLLCMALALVVSHA